MKCPNCGDPYLGLPHPPPDDFPVPADQVVTCTTCSFIMTLQAATPGTPEHDQAVRYCEHLQDTEGVGYARW